jgi:hypothetical protein
MYDAPEQDPGFSPPSDSLPENLDPGFKQRDDSDMPSVPAVGSSVGDRAVQPLTIVEPTEAQKSGIRPRRTAPKSQQLQDQLEVEQENERHPKDRNGRLVSSLLGLLNGAGEGARDVLSSGRPVDEYGLANIAGRAFGSGARAAVDPTLDERGKSKRRMLELQQQIGEAITVEKTQAENAQRQANAAYTAARPGIEADKARLEGEKIRAQSRPKGFTIGGRRIDYKLGEDGQTWVPYDATTEDGNPIVDPSKTPDANGLLPTDVETSRQRELDRKNRARIAENNNKYREEENEKNRKARSAQFNASLRERIAARIESDKQKREALGQGAARVKISMARVKVEAEKEGVSVNEYLDALSDNQVEVVK